MQKDILIYDSDCGFCQASVNRLRSIIGDSITYLPRTELKEGEYGISSDGSNRAIQFIVFDNDNYIVYSAAEAVFRAIQNQLGFFLWCYKYLPGFAWVSEKIYSWVSANRNTTCKI